MTKPNHEALKANLKKGLEECSSGQFVRWSPVFFLEQCKMDIRDVPLKAQIDMPVHISKSAWGYLESCIAEFHPSERELAINVAESFIKGLTKALAKNARSTMNHLTDETGRKAGPKKFDFDVFTAYFFCKIDRLEIVYIIDNSENEDWLKPGKESFSNYENEVFHNGFQRIYGIGLILSFIGFFSSITVERTMLTASLIAANSIFACYWLIKAFRLVRWGGPARTYTRRFTKPIRGNWRIKIYIILAIIFNLFIVYLNYYSLSM